MSLNKIFVNNTQVAIVDDKLIQSSNNLIKSNAIYSKLYG